MEQNTIPFTYELYQSGNYRVITRDGREVINFRNEFNTFSGNISGLNGQFLVWYNDGLYEYFKFESPLDLFLIPLDEKKEDIKVLLELLALHGGEIVSTSSLEPEWIEQARASGRLYVDEHSLGYVWQPDIKRIPETSEEVEFLEKWYPLDVKVKDGFFEEMWQKINQK